MAHADEDERKLSAEALRYVVDPDEEVYLIAQAISLGMTILTPDEAIRRYPVPTIW